VARDGSASIGDQVRTARIEAQDLRSEAMGIAGDVQRLLQLEGELAKAEANEAAGRIAKAAGLGAAAAVTGIVALVFLFLTVMFAIDTATELWLAALITTGIILLLVALLGYLAMEQYRRFSPVPRRFVRTVREDMEWVRSQIRSSAR
jgi:uncharacterized membrane protein YqjE